MSVVIKPVEPISKMAIDNLGKRIREEGDSISEPTLNELQNFRTSHKIALSKIFNMLCDHSNKVNIQSIVTYRIKRFESIIGKLNRFPKMRFSRMWDIGGCRCILKNDYEVYKLKERIIADSGYEVIKEYDYIVTPQPDGYRALHLFIKCKDNDKIIEVQLKNQVDHNWATLVEITDLLYDSGIKEFGRNKELSKLHLLLSKIELLTIEEKKEVVWYLRSYNFIEKLTEVFSRNYLSVRKKWVNIESQHNHKYFLIETSKDEVPKIESFSSALTAEESYFNVYKLRHNANIVLTHLKRPNYKQISMAYSNYILTFHSFLIDCYDIIGSLIIESIARRQLRVFYDLYRYFNEMVFEVMKNFVEEIGEYHDFYVKKKPGKNSLKGKKGREWEDDLRKQLNKTNDKFNQIHRQIELSMPTKGVNKFMFNWVQKSILKKTEKRISKIVPSANKQ